MSKNNFPERETSKKRPNVNAVDIFITALRGTEIALKEELREIGFRGAVADRGGARIKANSKTRFASACTHASACVFSTP